MSGRRRGGSGERPSKTQQKREMEALQTLGESLVELPDDVLATLDLPERLLAALQEARAITSRGALRRQRQYIGKLMRDVDDAPIRAVLASHHAAQRAEGARHRDAEAWRDRLLSDGAPALDALAEAFPSADVEELRDLVRRSDRRTDNPPARAARRELYRAIHRLLADDAPGDAGAGKLRG